MFLIFSFACLILLPLPARANILDWRIWSADTKLKSNKFDSAKAKYLQIQTKDPNNPRLNYNLGIANYRLGSMEQAKNSFQLAAIQTENKSLKHKSFYNLGNAQFIQDDYQSAIGSYEFALELDPDDEDTKHNLELARKKLEEQKQQQKNDSNDDSSQGDSNSDNQDSSDDQNKNADDDQKKKENDKKDKQEQSSQQPKAQPKNNNKDRSDDTTRSGGLSEKDLERMLMQAEEADPSEVNQNRSINKGQGTTKNLNPW